MNIAPNLFKAYDIRGLVGSELTSPIAEAVGRGLADWLPSMGPVAVGYDMRPDSRELAAAVRHGLTLQGRDVIDIGEVASDMIYYAVGSLKAAGGAMVTASHNPGQYNGIKMCAEAARPISIETGLADIRDAIEADDYKVVDRRGEITKRNIMDAWVTHALSFVEPKSWPAYHIAVDTGNGMGGEVMPHLDDKTPLVIEPMFYKLDGTFPNHPANPLVAANLVDEVAEIKADRLDFGIAFDGDGDRAFLVDETGRIVPGNIMSAFLAKHFLKQFPGSNIIYDARNSRLVVDVITENGGIPIKSRVGHSFIKQAMRENDAPFGGEFSGHFYFRDNYYADSGLIAALVGVQVVADSGKTLSGLVDEYASRYARSQENNFKVADKAAMLARLERTFADGEADHFDGLTVNYADWWFNARPSNTEPFLRLNVEATTPQRLDEKLDQLTQILNG
ncbi:phosphomannomutase/phosphoglucomutase [Candidatus Saccharibacteria bacterium]|nr:phosphomannomutase/phosphoglucomutase [Candidatus Saccharibacteria bacterium]